MTKNRLSDGVRSIASIIVASFLLGGLMVSVAGIAKMEKEVVANTTRSATLSEPTWVTVPLPAEWHSLTHGFHHYAVETLADEVWIGGRRVIIHYDGEETEILASDPMSASISAIDMIGPGEGWIVGGSGMMYEFDGERWTNVPSPVAASGVGLDDLEMYSSDSGVACGAIQGGGGRAIHWNSLFWQTRHMPTWSCDGLSVLTPDDIWAVGQEGLIAHYDGTAWSAYTSPTTIDLRAIDMVSAEEGWAVGVDGVILHYTDTAWSIVTSPTTAHLHALDMVDSENGWAGGDELLRYDGGSWITVTTPVALGGSHDHSKIIADISMLSETEGWAVGTMNLIMRYTTESGGGLAEIGEFDAIWERLYLPHVFSNMVRR